MLANVFLHYVLDEWFEKEIKPQVEGQCYLVRYCDDFIILVQYQEEAYRILELLCKRFAQYELQLHPEKTRVMSFGKYEAGNAQKQSRRANTFDFLGLTHYGTKSRHGGCSGGAQDSGEEVPEEGERDGTVVQGATQQAEAE